MRYTDKCFNEMMNLLKENHLLKSEIEILKLKLKEIKINTKVSNNEI